MGKVNIMHLLLIIFIAISVILNVPGSVVLDASDVVVELSVVVVVLTVVVRIGSESLCTQ